MKDLGLLPSHFHSSASMRPVSTGQNNALRVGDIAFARMEKVNSELVAITYGALVSQLMRGELKENAADVHHNLDKIGHNMGIRLVDEFLAKNGTPANCQSFKDSMEVLSKVAVKMFLGIDSDITEINAKTFLLTFAENPLNDFVELPSHLISSQFAYSNLYCGIIRGALEQLHMRVRCEYVKDTLRGDDVNAIQVELLGIVCPDDDE